VSTSALRRRTLGLLFAAFIFLGLPRVGFAATLVFIPPGSADMQDLDHQYVYTWLIQNLNNTTLLPGGVNSITGAKLKIANVTNWNAGQNHLYLHLLDSVLTTTADAVTNNSTTLLRLANGTAGYASVTSQVYRIQDDLTTSVTLRDDLARDTDLAPDYTAAGRLMLSQTTLGTTGNTAIGNMTGTETVDNSGTANDHILTTAWAVGVGGDSTHSFTLTPQNYELDLTPYLANLRAYITSGGDMAIGFDPDCHFFNDGISLEIYTNTQTVLQGVPEPASMTLLATGFAALYLRRRSTKRTKA
jgi:hypothetical protein